MDCPLCCKKLNKNDGSLVLEKIRYHERCVIQAIHITNHLGNLLKALFGQ